MADKRAVSGRIEKIEVESGKMKILYYQTNHRADNVCIMAMKELGCQIETFSCPLQNEEQEQRFLPLIRQSIKEQHADAIYSFDYFPVLSECCQAEECLYISYCCDMPTLAMFSANITNTCNRILTADSAMVEEFRLRGQKESYYLPLAPILSVQETERACFCDNTKIIFAGSLHEDNMYKHFMKLPDTARGYLDGITSVQVHIHGYSLFPDLMKEDNFWNTMMQSISLRNCVNNQEKYQYIIEHYFLEQQTTKLERSMIVKRLSERYKEKFHFYTQDTCSIPDVTVLGSIPYGKKLAAVFCEGSISLNITNRAHISAIPQNAWDILACGGLLISNYQADYNGLLEPGKDFVIYESIQELIELIEYYLNHSKERIEIAENGKKKVLAEHTWKERVSEILMLIS